MSAETIHTSDLPDAAQRWRRKKTPHTHWEISPPAGTFNSLLNFLRLLQTLWQKETVGSFVPSFIFFFFCTHSVPNCMFVSNAGLIPTGRLSRNRFLSSPSVRKGQAVSWAALQRRRGGGEEGEEEELCRWAAKSLLQRNDHVIEWRVKSEERFACKQRL